MSDRSKRSASQNVSFHESDQDITLHSIKRLMVGLQKSFDEHKDDVKKRLEEHKNDFKKKIDNQSKSINKLEQSIKSTIQLEIKGLQTYIDQEISIMVNRMKDLESRIAKIEEKQEDNDLYNYDTTVIISNMPYEQGEDLNLKVDTLLRNGLHVTGLNVVRVLRLNSHNRHPGLVKVQLASLNEKIKLLKSKGNLAHSDAYRKIFIRSSKPHGERIAEHNLRTIMSFIPGLNKDYRLTGNGKLIMKSDGQPPARPTERPPTFSHPFTPSNDPRAHLQYSMTPYDEQPSVYIHTPMH